MAEFIIRAFLFAIVSNPRVNYVVHYFQSLVPQFTPKGVRDLDKLTIAFHFLLVHVNVA